VDTIRAVLCEEDRLGRQAPLFGCAPSARLQHDAGSVASSCGQNTPKEGLLTLSSRLTTLSEGMAVGGGGSVSAGCGSRRLGARREETNHTAGPVHRRKCQYEQFVYLHAVSPLFS
jgi:hypothetical protein